MRNVILTLLLVLTSNVYALENYWAGLGETIVTPIANSIESSMNLTCRYDRSDRLLLSSLQKHIHCVDDSRKEVVRIIVHGNENLITHTQTFGSVEVKFLNQSTDCQDCQLIPVR